uniref:Uncharacterized protein n=1 Tax=Arundo donax TaxID=35708 RepID=A0A0A8Y8U8_ARUDO
MNFIFMMGFKMQVWQRPNNKL